MNHLLRCQQWILGQSRECRNVPLRTFVGEKGIDAEIFSRAFGGAALEGLYAFVWVGEFPLKTLPPVKLKGKKVSEESKKKGILVEDGHHIHEVRWELDDFPIECRHVGSPRFPLYVGKTTNFYKRMQQHLHLSIEDWKVPAKVHRNGAPQTTVFQEGYLHKHSTACQFRSGMEHLMGYPSREDFHAALQHIELCFMPNTDVKDRFYMEDLAIGYFRPWFNVDSER